MNYELQLLNHLKVFEQLCEKSMLAANFLQRCHEMQNMDAPALMAAFHGD